MWSAQTVDTQTFSQKWDKFKGFCRWYFSHSLTLDIDYCLRFNTHQCFRIWARFLVGWKRRNDFFQDCSREGTNRYTWQICLLEEENILSFPSVVSNLRTLDDIQHFILNYNKQLYRNSIGTLADKCNIRFNSKLICGFTHRLFMSRCYNYSLFYKLVLISEWRASHERIHAQGRIWKETNVIYFL